MEPAGSAAPFDPVGRLFVAQDHRPPGLADVDPRELSALQRALLAIDGTVTSFLAAWAMEPVVVKPLTQHTVVLREESWLDASAGTPAMERAVLLTGGHSGRVFAFAESVICVDRLPAALRTGLESGGMSLGQLLLMPGVESRREGLWYGREKSARLPPAVASLTGPDFLTRTYRVSAESRPLMLITERFPWTLRA